MGVRVVVKAIAPAFSYVVYDFHRRYFRVRPVCSFDRAEHRQLFDIRQLFQCSHGYWRHSRCDSDWPGSALCLARAERHRSYFHGPACRSELLSREVRRISRWGCFVQSGGVLALEDEANKVHADEVLHFGVELILSGKDGDEVGEILLNVAATTYERNTVEANLLKSMGATAPAFGIIGTLVGLIIMLDSMGDDPSKLGSGLAVALNTTLYGVLLARLVFIPVVAKQEQREQIGRFRNELMAEGLALLAGQTSPHTFQDRMNSFLDPAIRFDIDQQLRGGAEEAAE